MKLTDKGIEYDREESLTITNKGEKMLNKHRNKGKCMYCDCTIDSINSHTISKMGSLSTISANGNVGYFISKRNELEKNLIYANLSINNATTFKGFCSTHDSELFNLIDNNSESKTDEEILLQSYRSVCKSLFDESYFPPLELFEEPTIDLIKDYLRNDESYKSIDLDAEEFTIKQILDSIISDHKNKLLETSRILLDYKQSIENDVKCIFPNIAKDNDGIRGTKTNKVQTSDKKVTILYNRFDWRIPVSIFNHFRFKVGKSVDSVLNFTYIPYENSAEVYWIFSSKDFDYFYKYWESFISERIHTLNRIESCMMAQENWCIDPQIIDYLPEERQNVLFKDMYYSNERTNIFENYDMSIFDDIRNQLIDNNKCNANEERAKLSVPIRKNDGIRNEEFNKAIDEML